ncbi:MAG: NAD-dependent protein deacylase [Thermodesulfobacteriota bacterium]|nr:NAD-dependent protein deacylase [Thermodesulfobacteriota bacterium]
MSVGANIEKAAEILARARNAVVSSGAGMSAESGIATFRDPGGVWERLDPAWVGTTGGLLNALQTDPAPLISMFDELLDVFERAMPNPGHKALFELEALGVVKTVITQNIDNLHQEAGSSRVLEVHGNGFRFCCLSCGARRSMDRKALIKEVREQLAGLSDFSPAALMDVMPQCDQCASMMRPDVVMFGESVQQIPEAFDAVRSADAMLALGTSGVVYPAAYFPFEAKKAGAPVIVINPNENAFEAVSDVYVPMKAGEAMPAIAAKVREKRG